MDQSTSIPVNSIDLALEPSFRLAGLSIEPPAREARFNGTTELVQPQPLKVLVALFRQRGKVVRRDEIARICWDGRIVGEDVINRAILLLRSLGRRSGAFSIETVPRAGYRLVEAHSGNERNRRSWILAGITALAAIAIFAATSTRRVKVTAPLVIAVLPVTSSGDASFQSLSVSVRNALLHMLSDSSLPARSMNDLTSARWSADFILATDLRREGQGVIATLQLVEAREGSVLFSKVFRTTLSSAEALPDQIGAYAAANLTWAGTLRILDGRQPADPRLTTELLKQLFLTVEGGDMLRAYEMSEQIAAGARNSTMAQLGLAHNTGLVFASLPSEERPQALVRARRAAQRAKQLSPDFGDVYTLMCLLNPLGWQARCEDDLREGLRADPQAPYAAAYLRRWLSEVGRNREALRYARMSLANDPYKPGKLAGLIGRLEALNQQAEAATVFRSAIRWWPHNGVFYVERLNGMAQRGDLPAIARFAERSPSDMFPVDREAAVRLVNSVETRRRQEARAICADAAPQAAALGTLCLVALTQLGDLDDAFRLARALYPPRVAATNELEERIWLKDPAVVPTAFLSSPALARLRRDPRFLPLATSLGLTRYWRRGRLPDFCRTGIEAVCEDILPRAQAS